MTTTVTTASRVQRIVDLVEEILADIAAEHDTPHTAVVATVEFFTDLQRRISRVSHGRLAAFIQQKHRPGD